MILSVALCSHNGEKFLKAQLESILHQVIPVHEIIICDDNSKDDSVKIIEKIREQYPSVIKLFKNRRQLGTIKNFEKAISLTQGDLIFLSDQDDIWSSEKVSRTVSFFKTEKKCKLLFTNGALIDQNGNSLNSTLWDEWKFDQQSRNRWKNNTYVFEDLLENKNKITGATLCFHKSLKALILPIDIPPGYWHDAWLGLNASAVNGVFFMKDCLIEYRLHDMQQVGVSRIFSKEKFPQSVSPQNFYRDIQKKHPWKFCRYRAAKFLKENKVLKSLKRLFS